ncbi:AAA family ATPase [Pseudoalteromonas sp. JBTF-M23]|uniref:AAA family ATPase n=1 Tax=Pseudoalteromonas caenipelagi TaxID=2726988 RepID=A0A849VB78_9GAMM|nr:AAA family ATPase [Pseudoalteromonas caenipelagi]NOU50245.1 AAA family ATPase [Pseudoalteromonas caenipelagi]
MKFTPHYNELQQKQVAILNAEIELFDINPTEYCLGWPLDQVNTILKGESPINPKKVLDKLWQHFFGDFDAENFGTDSAISNTYSEDDKLVLARIKKRMQDKEFSGQGVTSSTLSSRLRKSPGMISQLLNGKYAANPSKYLHEVWAMLEPAGLDEQTEEPKQTSEKKPITIRYGEVPFVQTSVPNLIRMACEQARDRRRIAVFAGQAGIGKSKGIERYREDHNDVLSIEGDEETSSTQILEELAKQLGIPKTGSNSVRLKKIITALKDSERLIILDEADKCRPNALDPLRTISDRAFVGVVLVGNIRLIDKLQSEERYELISSRVCFWPSTVGELPVTDIKTLFCELTQNTLPIAEDSDKWWQWLHKRVEGNARMLVEGLLPHLLTHIRKNPSKKVDRLMVNSIFATVLNKPTI